MGSRRVPVRRPRVRRADGSGEVGVASYEVFSSKTSSPTRSARRSRRRCAPPTTTPTRALPRPPSRRSPASSTSPTPGAAGSRRVGLAEPVTVSRLGVPPMLARTVAVNHRYRVDDRDLPGPFDGREALALRADGDAMVLAGMVEAARSSGGSTGSCTSRHSARPSRLTPPRPSHRHARMKTSPPDDMNSPSPPAVPRNSGHPRQK